MKKKIYFDCISLPNSIKFLSVLVLKCVCRSLPAAVLTIFFLCSKETKDGSVLHLTESHPSNSPDRNVLSWLTALTFEVN